MVARVVLVLVILASVSPGLCSNSMTCTPCPPGWTRWRNNCYRFYNQPRLNFDDSKDFCASFVPLGSACPCHTAHLASVESDDENNFLFDWWDSMREPATKRQNVRIGYTGSAVEDTCTWQWTDGSSATFTAWDSGQPDNTGGLDCYQVVMRTKGESSSGDRRWDDEPCNIRRPFFCKFRPLD